MWGKSNKKAESLPSGVENDDDVALETAISSIAEMIFAIHRISVGFSPASIQDEDERDRLIFRLEFLHDEATRAAKENGLTVPQLIGVEISPNLAVIVDNGDDFSPQDKLVVATVLEPLITFGNHTLRQGRVIAELATTPETGAAA